ncbi:MAG: anti-sigma factor family protein, partial [Pirellulaceae bacterium]
MSEPGDLRWDEDLLSGYLDGELSEPQQQLVRQRLTSDPAARDLLRRLVEQREQMLRCNDAIPMIDLSRRIAERIAPVDPAVRPQRPTDANGSRSAWRFAAALLAASLVGILIGPWFLRSRHEVTLQSPASQSSSALRD